MNFPDTLTTREVADLFDVTLHTVRAWRQPAYAGSPLHLLPDIPSTAPTKGGNKPAPCLYSWNTLNAFIARNPKYALHVRCYTGRPIFRGKRLEPPIRTETRPDPHTG
jgi:hypothetical protein